MIARPIAAGGMELLDALMKNNPSTIMAQQLVSIALHDKDRVRSIAIRAMGDLIQLLFKGSDGPSPPIDITANIAILRRFDQSKW